MLIVKQYGIIFFAIVLVSVSHVMIKYSTRKHYPSALQEYLNPVTITGYTLLLLSAFITIFALRYIPFKSFQVYMSLTYLFILLMGHFVLGERITKEKIIGNSLIVVGIIVFNQ